MIDALDYQVLAAINNGLPLVSRPYAQLAEQLGMTEYEILNRLSDLKTQGIIKRFGVIVKHRQLGYRANAMVVFDIPNNIVAETGKRISQFEFINLCYQRPRYPEWSYNLYCMIHGKSRETVLQQLDELVSQCQLTAYQKQVLFSRRCFKQCGAMYSLPPT